MKNVVNQISKELWSMESRNTVISKAGREIRNQVSNEVINKVNDEVWDQVNNKLRNTVISELSKTKHKVMKL